MAADPDQLRNQIRTILLEAIPTDDAALNRALDRIMDLVDPFQQAAHEEMEHFRSTFAELAK